MNYIPQWVVRVSREGFCIPLSIIFLPILFFQPVLYIVSFLLGSITVNVKTNLPRFVFHVDYEHIYIKWTVSSLLRQTKERRIFFPWAFKKHETLWLNTNKKYCETRCVYDTFFVNINGEREQVIVQITKEQVLAQWPIFNRRTKEYIQCDIDSRLFVQKFRLKKPYNQLIVRDQLQKQLDKKNANRL